MGVAHFIVTDNGSVDGTGELLDELAWELSIDSVDEATPKSDQDLCVTRMAMRVHSDGESDWIINTMQTNSGYRNRLRCQNPDYRYHNEVHAVRRTVPLRPGKRAGAVATVTFWRESFKAR